MTRNLSGLMYASVPTLAAAITISACGEPRSLENGDTEDTGATEIASVMEGLHAQPMASNLSEASVIIETNCTDGDSGIQLFVDGNGWDKLFILGPQQQLLGTLSAHAGLGRVGLTELFTEGEEPELVYPAGLDCTAEEPEGSLESFLENYPAGNYTFVARSVEKTWLIGSAELTHAIPNGPEILSPLEQVPQDPDDLVIRWNSGSQPDGIDIVSQQVIVEIEDESAGFLRVFDIELGPEATMVSVPSTFFDSIDGVPDAEMKVEVLVKEASGNQTITERQFELAE